MIFCFLGMSSVRAFFIFISGCFSFRKRMAFSTACFFFSPKSKSVCCPPAFSVSTFSAPTPSRRIPFVISAFFSKSAQVRLYKSSADVMYSPEVS